MTGGWRCPTFYHFSSLLDPRTKGESNRFSLAVLDGGRARGLRRFSLSEQSPDLLTQPITSAVTCSKRNLRTAGTSAHCDCDRR